jgi:outer membrane protein assembly factor BamE (lipoprotein component of BamABCDE complex)
MNAYLTPGRKLAAFALLFALAPACASVTQQANDVATAAAAGDRVTVGTVQREIRVGMSGAEVVTALGAPNIVSTDERRREVWVYDRIATESVSSSSSGGVNALFLAGVGGRTGVARTSQRTLTVIVRFDEQARVRDFSYRSSSF